MLAAALAILLLLAAVAGVYALLRDMGNDGIEAAAPGSCKRGRCGVTPKPPTGELDEQVILIDDIKRKDALSDQQRL